MHTPPRPGRFHRALQAAIPALVLIFAISRPAFASTAAAAQLPVSYSVPGFPHPAVYMTLSSDGFQLNSDSMVAKIARFDVAVIPASPATETYANRLQQIRSLNPNIVLLAYFPADFMWDGSQLPAGSVYGDCWRMFQNNDWWLYATDGTPFTYFGGTFDLTRPDVQAGLAGFLWQRVLSTGLWDGIFLDDFCESEYWKQGFNGQLIDENRDGVPDDRAVLDPLWKTGTDSLASKLRQLAGPTMPIVGNCSYGSKWSTMNGWMREDFPYQGNWTSNMFSAQGGYMVNEQKFRSPHFDFVYATSAAPPNQYSASNLKFMRYCLASTLMGNGYFMFDPRVDTLQQSSFWFDEYDGAGRGMGYLGQPLGDYYQQVASLTTPDLLANPGFEGSFTPWQPYDPVGNIIRDSWQPPVGSASAHAFIPSPTLYQTTVHLQQNVTLPWGAWAVTFYARAAVARTIWVSVQQTTSPYTILCNCPVNVTTGWNRYQVTFVYGGDTVPVALQMQMGVAVGDVWLDDVELQQGASNIYRRDFQKGTVLLNTTSYPVNVPLEQPYWALSGKQDPVTNNGKPVSQVTVQPGDALILVTIDPATVAADRQAQRDIRFRAIQSVVSSRAEFEVQLPEVSRVTVDIFEATGRHVDQLGQAALSPGRHSWTWDGRTAAGARAPTGIYFARVTVQNAHGETYQSARVVLIR
jgi:hypothetical protein